MVKPVKPDFADIDDYIFRLDSRISDIETNSKILVNTTSETRRELERGFDSIDKELDYVRKSISAAKIIINRQKMLIKELSKEFKGIAKKDQFERLKEKVDIWGPERFITKNELRKIFSQP